ncbi:hypothetical protein C0Q44_20040 [Paenibacillus sp. PCH8]|nr:hypothetical protein C0Q44_20040 [Paenibacillus sp. PCH8]
MFFPILQREIFYIYLSIFGVLVKECKSAPYFSCEFYKIFCVFSIKFYNYRLQIRQPFHSSQK